jgi:hypothetical protein
MWTDTCLRLTTDFAAFVLFLHRRLKLATKNAQSGWKCCPRDKGSQIRGVHAARRRPGSATLILLGDLKLPTRPCNAKQPGSNLSNWSGTYHPSIPTPHYPGGHMPIRAPLSFFRTCLWRASLVAAEEPHRESIRSTETISHPHTHVRPLCTGSCPFFTKRPLPSRGRNRDY